MSRMTRRWLAVAAVLSAALASAAGRAEPPAGSSAPAAPGSVQVMFLPPPLEAAVYSVGIYETKTGRLVRRLHEGVEDGAFTAGLNGFITSWDRRDDTGKTVPAGRYAAHGWAVGEMRVEGVDILGNEWTEEDEGLRITNVEGICLVPADDGLVVLAGMADGSTEVLRIGGEDGRVWWRAKPKNPGQGKAPLRPALRVQGERVVATVRGQEAAFAVTDGRELPAVPRQPIGPGDQEGSFGPADGSAGRAGTWWILARVWLVQLPEGRPTEAELAGTEAGLDHEPALLKAATRHLSADGDRPEFTAVSASQRRDRLYLLEKTAAWQRVRGLEFSETKRDAAGQPVSEWKTFFERNIRRPDPTLGLDETAPSPVLELPLAKNPLEPGKPQRARLRAGFDTAGSYLETADGLRLLPVSARPNLRAARLARDPKSPDRLLFTQFDGAAWDVFGVTGPSRALVSFDAGEFELTTDGERRPEPPTDEPRDP